MDRAYGPMPANSPHIGATCAACHEPFKKGDWTALVPLGPGGNASERESARKGNPYNSVSVQLHWACRTGVEL